MLFGKTAANDCLLCIFSKVLFWPVYQSAFIFHLFKESDANTLLTLHSSRLGHDKRHFHKPNRTKNETNRSEQTYKRPRHQLGSSWSSVRLGQCCRRWARPGRSTAPPTRAPDGSCSSSGPPCTTAGRTERPF